MLGNQSHYLLNLTNHERQAMELLVAGKKDKEIGVILGVSFRVANRRIASVCTKFGATTRPQAAAMFVREQLKPQEVR